MRRSAAVAAVLGAVIAPVAGAAAAPRPVRIVVLGDSLALATGASRADGGFIFPAFRDLLRRLPGSRLDNVAIGGSTVADVVRLQLPRVRADAPDVVVVCVGANDVVRETAPARFAALYADLLRGVARAAPRARVLCCGVPNVGLTPLFADSAAAVAQRSRADDRGAHAAALRAGAAYLDFFDVAPRGVRNDGAFFSADRFHPSDVGYGVLRSLFEPALLRAAG